MDIKDFKEDTMSLNALCGTLNKIAKEYEVFKKGSEVADYLSKFDDIVLGLKADKARIEREIDDLYEKDKRQSEVHDKNIDEKMLQMEQLVHNYDEMLKQKALEQGLAEKKAIAVVEEANGKVVEINKYINTLKVQRDNQEKENQTLVLKKQALEKAMENLKKKFD